MTQIDDQTRLTCGDAISVLPTLAAGSVDLIFSDPPFNIGFEYDAYKDNRPASEYLEWCESWIGECHRILTPTGSFWLMTGTKYAAELCVVAKDLGFHLRSWCEWHYTFGVNQSNNFTNAHIPLLYFTKHPKKFTFNADAIRVPSARQAKYKDKRANPKGRLPDNVWSTPRVCGTFKERTGHPCQTPESILERIVKACSNPGDLVVDPFGGSFTTAAVCARLGRPCVSCDISEAYVEAGRKRVAEVRRRYVEAAGIGAGSLFQGVG